MFECSFENGEESISFRVSGNVSRDVFESWFSDALSYLDEDDGIPEWWVADLLSGFYDSFEPKDAVVVEVI